MWLIVSRDYSPYSSDGIHMPDRDADDLAVILDFITAGRIPKDHTQKTFKKTSKKKSFGYQCRSFTGSGAVREAGGLTRWETTIRLSGEPLPKWGEGKMKFQVSKFTCEVLLGDDGKLVVRWFPEPPKYLNKAERDQYQAGIAEFLEELERKLGKDRSNLPRLNGAGCG